MLFPCDGMDLERKERPIRIPTYVHKNARMWILNSHVENAYHK